MENNNKVAFFLNQLKGEEVHIWFVFMLIRRCLSEASAFIMITFKSCVKLQAQGPNVACHKVLCGSLFNFKHL